MSAVGRPSTAVLGTPSRQGTRPTPTWPPTACLAPRVGSVARPSPTRDSPHRSGARCPWSSPCSTWTVPRLTVATRLRSPHGGLSRSRRSRLCVVTTLAPTSTEPGVAIASCTSSTRPSSWRRRTMPPRGRSRTARGSPTSSAASASSRIMPARTGRDCTAFPTPPAMPEGGRRTERSLARSTRSATGNAIPQAQTRTGAVA